MMASAETDKRQKELNVYRDTVESIGVAIVLAFVLRAFVVEAFVIPTGSMAPRLLGEHWDLTCPLCGYPFAYGADKDDIDSGKLSSRERTAPEGARCPNCRKQYPTGNDGKESKDYWQYLSGGDRVLVMKYLYNFLEPQPWDVVVFKNPQDNRENYIKRLIGLPGETLEIVHGNIFFSPGSEPSSPRSIRRKPPKVQEAMWQIVFDNDLQVDPNDLAARSAPRWRGGRGAASWNLTGEDGRLLAFRGATEPAEVYLHQEGDRGLLFAPHYGYNNPIQERDDPEDEAVCSDLKLSAVFTPRDRPVSVTLTMSSFEFQFEAAFRSDGGVTLSCRSPDLPGGSFQKAAQVSPLAPGKGHVIALTHVDFRAAAWVDGQCVVETLNEEYPDALAGDGRKGCYAWLQKRLQKGAVPVPELRILASGGPCELRHVAVHRDVYYTAARLRDLPGGAAGAYAQDIIDANVNPNLRSLRKYDSSDARHRLPARGGRGWGTAGCPITLARRADDPDLDEFFVLGDNSPRSQDSRLWIKAAPTLRLYNDDGSFLYQLGTVPRYNLLGKAMFVYWPSGFRIPFLNRLAIVPNVGKMRFIR